MKTKIFYLLLLFSLCLTSAQAQWQMVYNGNKGWPRLFLDGDNLIMFNSVSGIAISKDSGFSWMQADTSFVMRYAGGFIRKGNKLLSPTRDGIYQSLDSGQNWSFLSSWPSWGNNWGGFCVSGNILIAGSDFDRVIISKDDGISWDSSNTGLLPTRISPRKVRSLYGFVNTGNNIMVFQDEKEFISYNHGETWHLKRDNIPFFSWMHYTVGNNIFSGGSDLYISTDSGANWQMIFSPQYKLNGVRGLIPAGDVIAGFVQEEGIIVSNDNGFHWHYMNKGLPTLEAGGLVVAFGYIYCGTSTGKVYRRPLSELFGEEETVGIEEKNKEVLKLKAYPNPAQHSATIAFGRNLKNAEIKIYNMQGQEVLFITEINSKEIKIETSKLPAGVYFYNLFEKSKKLATGKLVIE